MTGVNNIFTCILCIYNAFICYPMRDQMLFYFLHFAKFIIYKHIYNIDKTLSERPPGVKKGFRRVTFCHVRLFREFKYYVFVHMNLKK